MFWFIITLIVVGLIVGLIARWLVPGAVGGGILTDIVVGIAGSFIGGFIYQWIGHGALTPLWSFIYALIGAVILLLILRAFSGRRTVV
ncbi:MAG TPA: GlsB/YeaQ/YmgE family stress response membrane protein [Candidatus Rubrimentiphilum sp.]|nr:GlsB/YeaQ/YmgE family stress response membrane protein [Candidatus Rubrimentiphilum sp.]